MKAIHQMMMMMMMMMIIIIIIIINQARHNPNPNVTEISATKSNPQYKDIR
jgi:hypothetical protein